MSPNTHQTTHRPTQTVRTAKTGSQGEPHMDRLNRLLLVAKVLQR